MDPWLIGVVVLAVAIGAGVLLLRGGKPAKGTPRPVPAARPVRPQVASSAVTVAEPAAPIELPEVLAGLVLREEADLTSGQRDALSTALRDITLPSPTLRELASPDFLENGSAKELSELIMREPAVATKVLAVVNSPLFGLQSPIVSVLHAINFLGLNSVRGIVMNSLLEQSFTTVDPELKQLHARLWDAATIASELVHQLAQRLEIPNRGALATQVLLGFVGHFATLTLVPGETGRTLLQSGLVERTRAEQERIGLCSAFVAAQLMQRWGLPQALVEGVHDIALMLVTGPDAMPPARGVPLALCYACVRIAERVAFEDLRDVAELDLLAEDRADTFHLRAWLARPELAKLNAHLNAPDLANPMRRMIAAVGSR